MANVKQKHAQVRQILTRLTGKEPVQAGEKIKFLMWTHCNITVELYEDGRMVMY